jgi:hypothetical protein
MIKFCPVCDQQYRPGELVEVVVIAPWNPIKSTVAFSLGKPVDAYPDTLKHHDCAKENA